MARVRYRRRAEEDLDSIAEYSLERWGHAQAERYVNGLQRLCEHLDELPILNRPHNGQYLRRGYEAHAVFFRREDDGGILIVRILHAAMLQREQIDSVLSPQGTGLIQIWRKWSPVSLDALNSLCVMPVPAAYRPSGADPWWRFCGRRWRALRTPAGLWSTRGRRRSPPLRPGTSQYRSGAR